jgi:hypothetical protein
MEVGVLSSSEVPDFQCLDEAQSLSMHASESQTFERVA